MACKDQRRFAVESQLRKQFVGARPDFDPAILGARGIVLPDMIEVREFGANATEIVPDACENDLDLCRRFLRKCGGQIGAADLLLPHQGPDRAGDPAEQVGGLDRIEIAGATQYSDRQRTHRGLAQRLGRVAKSGLGAKQQTLHQKPTTILPNTIRLSMRFSVHSYTRAALYDPRPTSSSLRVLRNS